MTPHSTPRTSENLESTADSRLFRYRKIEARNCDVTKMSNLSGMVPLDGGSAPWDPEEPMGVTMGNDVA